jgi:endoglucanase
LVRVILTIFLAATAVLLLSVWWFYSENSVSCEAIDIVNNTWSGFKRYFMDDNGRVKQVRDGDTVSEGQAYAMLRAVWMNDKAAFDKCYIWTEKNLSRADSHGDSLLSWHWKDGSITDLMPASDADIDYALSLIFADGRWKGLAPAGVEGYGAKARLVLEDILRLETYSTSTGRLYLSPWILDTATQPESLPVNPSYYSPAHFRIFYEYTKDSKWLALINTTYYILDSLSHSFIGLDGVGLVPDWCSVDNNDRLSTLEGRNNGFGYEAIRVPFRVGLDFVWFDSELAREFLSNFSNFLIGQFESEGAVFCEYDYTGKALKKYESPAFYACFYYSLVAGDGKYSKVALLKNRIYLRKSGPNWFYQDQQDYYLNSLAWLADGLQAGVIKNLYNNGGETND